MRLADIIARWRFVLTVMASAAVIACAVSEILPRRYTSTATVVIAPPATSDMRTFAAVNPAYLDSLRTFENFFTSDMLFLEAARRFHIDVRNRDIDTVRGNILRVKQEHETRILEVSVTLPDAAAASKMLHFITDQSIAASGEQAVAADLESMNALNAELDRARQDLARARTEWERASANDTPESIQSSIESGMMLDSDIRGRESEADADAQEWAVRARDGDAQDRAYAQIESRAAAARRDELARRRQRVEAEIARDRKMLAGRSSRLTLTTAELEQARKAFDAAQARVRDFGAVAGMRSERMRVIDPGIVPQTPSSPKVLLNTLAAVLLAACLSIAWVAIGAGEHRPKPAVVRSAQRLA